MPKAVIVGAGLSGMMAAKTLAEQGWSSTLVSNAPSQRAQSVMAEGGINAALNNCGDGDSPQVHAQDTLKSACGLVDPETVEGFAKAAPQIIAELAAMGTMFNVEGGKPAQRPFGGQSKARTVYARSETGKQLMSALISEVRRWEFEKLVARMSHHTFKTLLQSAEGCCGVVLVDDQNGEEVSLEADAVIMACGGMSGLFPQFTGSLLNTGIAQAELFRLGVEMANLEFVQYHPTAFAVGPKAYLVTEAVRGEGGRLFTLRDGEPWYFMEEKYERGNLETRDVTARECYRMGQQSQVYLDFSSIPSNVIEGKLTGVVQTIRRYLHVDPATSPVPIAPAVHYFMGGIRVDGGHRTSMPGLYAAGECAAQYHGANRLGGNSLMGALYGGKVAAQTVMADGPREHSAIIDGGEVPQPMNFGQAIARKKALHYGMGVVRDEATLKESLEKLDALDHTPMLELSKAMILSALIREESRGAHFREDFPAADEAFSAQSVARFKDGECTIRLESVTGEVGA